MKQFYRSLYDAIFYYGDLHRITGLSPPVSLSKDDKRCGKKEEAEYLGPSLCKSIK